MSRSDRDQRGGHPVRYHSHLDCLCCPDLSHKHLRTRARGSSIRADVTDGLDEIAEDRADVDQLYDLNAHVYLAGRCVRCNMGWIDASIYPELSACPGKADDAPICFSTSTGEMPTASHDIV